MPVLGESMRLRREELGLGQDDLAREVGVSQQTVSRWEQGVALPRPARVLALAKTLTIDPQWLLRVAGYLPGPETSSLHGPWQQLYDRLHELSRTELFLLLDRGWEELRAREGLGRPFAPLDGQLDGRLDGHDEGRAGGSIGNRVDERNFSAVDG